MNQIAIVFAFLYDIYFLLAHFYFSNVILYILNDTKQNKSKQIVAKSFHKKLEINVIKNKSIANSQGKEMIEYTLRKEIILKGNTTRYIEYNHKNTGTSCTSVHKFRLQCFDLSTKCLKTVSLKPYFGLSAEI